MNIETEPYWTHDGTVSELKVHSGFADDTVARVSLSKDWLWSVEIRGLRRGIYFADKSEAVSFVEQIYNQGIYTYKP